MTFGKIILYLYIYLLIKVEKCNQFCPGFSVISGLPGFLHFLGHFYFTVDNSCSLQVLKIIMFSWFHLLKGQYHHPFALLPVEKQNLKLAKTENCQMKILPDKMTIYWLKRIPIPKKAHKKEPQMKVHCHQNQLWRCWSSSNQIALR